MQVDHWETVEQLLTEALAMGGRERQALLAGIPNPDVRKEVQSLLRVSENSDSSYASLIMAAAESWRTTAVRVPDRFNLQREAGRGGMGVVFEAFDRERNLRVALKALALVSSAHLLSFKQEFRSLAGFVHPNVVTLYELIQDGDNYYLSMEFIDGISFADYLRAPSGEPGELYSLLRQIALGIDAIHAAGKIHRDLKPSNVMIDRSGRAVIVDLGLAAEREHERFGLPGTLFQGGTAPYMSPEHIDGMVIPASDWYSFGVMLFKAITGKLPFEWDGDSAPSEIDRGVPPSPRALAGARCPEDLDRLCRSLLHPDPSERPVAARVLEVLGQPETPPSGTRAGIPFVGRDGPLYELGNAFESLREGRASVVLIKGPAGSGKTALVESFLERTGAQPDVLVFTGRCYELDGVPYKGFDAILDQMSRFLGALPVDERNDLMRDASAPLSLIFPVLASVGHAGRAKAEHLSLNRVELRKQCFQALRGLAGRIANRWRLILWLDDLQWADSDVADLLLELLHGPSHPPVLLLCSHRASTQGYAFPAMDQFLDAVEREPVEKIKLDVGPLSPEDAADLAASILGDSAPCPRERALAIARDSGGLPLFIRELARAREAPDGAAPTLEGLIWTRVQQLPEEPRQVLFLTAISGRPVSREVILKAARISSRNPATISILTHASLLCSVDTSSSGMLHTFHDRVRETVVQRIGTNEKRRLHRSLAEVLELPAQDADAEMVAFHLEEGGDPAQASTWYRRAAGRAADVVAFDKAADLYGRALKLCELPPAERAELELKRAEMLANAGRSADAARCYFAAAGHLEPQHRLRVEGLAACYLCVAGHSVEGRACIDRLLESIGRKPLEAGTRTLAALLWRDLRCRLKGIRPLKEPVWNGHDPMLLARIDMLWFAAAGLGTTDLLGGMCLLLLSMQLTQESREPKRLIRAYAWYAGMQVVRQVDLRKVDAIFDRCRDLARQIGNPPESRAILALTTAIRHYHLGAWSRALPFCMEAEETIVAECRGLNWELAFTRALKFTLLMNLGKVEGLELAVGSTVEEAARRGDLATAITISSFPFPYSQIVAGKPESARRTWRYWLRQWPHREGSHQEAFGVLIDMWSALYEGNPAAAYETLQSGWKSPIVRSDMLRSAAASVYFWETRARVLIEMARLSDGKRRSAYTREARAIAARLKRCPATHAPAHAEQLSAALELLAGNRERALAGLARAQELFETNGMQIHACAARLRRGEWTGGAQGAIRVNSAVRAMRSMSIPDPHAVARMHTSM